MPQTQNPDITITIKALQKRVYRRGINYSLDRITDCLAKCDNPHLNLPPVIHVAGTNGKGSTVTYIKTGLMGLGQTVGTFTSPHLIRYNERIQLNGAPISNEDFISLFNTVDQVDPDHQLTEFEVLTVMALVHFAKLPKTNTFIILETGLGGRLDTTNVVTPVCSVITRIGMDHEAILGNTIEKIAHEKAGIIKKNIPVFSVDSQLNTVKEVLKETAEKQDCIYTETKPLPAIPKKAALRGNFQCENRALAETVLKTIIRRFAIPKASTSLNDILDQAFIWGRYTQTTVNNNPVIIDGAHNPEATRALYNQIQLDYPNSPINSIIGFSKDKNTSDMLPIIQDHSTHIHYCEFDDFLSKPQSLVSDTLAPISIDAIIPTVTNAPDNTIWVLTGSLYFIGTLAEHTELLTKH
ncbi:hypothetical protein HOH87_05915 [bacterium]|jgi:dihydrofolate synthase / folylpolyglutamate synthase|nr:hypothetical protein [bacterium]